MARLRGMRVCPEPGCPEPTAGGRCDTHRAQYERRRGTRQQRGYDQTHVKLRANWKRKVDRCEVKCARCRQLILPGETWHLDHTDDRAGYLGPSHERCNTSAGGKAAHR
jgi:hypothetical protein